MIYQVIEKAGNAGIWTRDIKTSTNISQVDATFMPPYFGTPSRLEETLQSINLIKSGFGKFSDRSLRGILLQEENETESCCRVARFDACR